MLQQAEKLNIVITEYTIPNQDIFQSKYYYPPRHSI